MKERLRGPVDKAVPTVGLRVRIRHEIVVVGHGDLDRIHPQARPVQQIDPGEQRRPACRRREQLPLGDRPITRVLRGSRRGGVVHRCKVVVAAQHLARSGVLGGEQEDAERQNAKDRAPRNAAPLPDHVGECLP